MRNLLLLSLIVARAAFGGCSTLTIPTDYLTVDAFRRTNQAANWTATAMAHNNCKDSTNLLLQRITGLGGSMWLKSPQDFIVQLDADNNGTHKFFLFNGNADTLFRVNEDSTAKFFGTLTLNKPLTLNDSLIGTSVRLGGNTAAVNGSYSGTLNVKGVQTDSAALSFGATGTAADWSIWRSAANGLSIRGGAGSPYDFSLFNPAANYLMRNPTGTQTLEFPGTGGIAVTGKITGSDTVAAALGIRLGSVAGSSPRWYRSGTNMTTTPESLTVQGKLSVTDSILGSAARFSGRFTADTLISPKFYNDTGTFTATFTGMASGGTGTAYYVRVGRQVTVYLPTLSGTSNATTGTITGLPSFLWPARLQSFMVYGFLFDNALAFGATKIPMLNVNTSGTLSFNYFVDNSSSTGPVVFTASGSKSLLRFNFTYLLQ